MGTLLCIYNPLSGSGSVMARMPHLENAIRAKNYKYISIELTAPDFEENLIDCIRSKNIQTKFQNS